MSGGRVKDGRKERLLHLEFSCVPGVGMNAEKLDQRGKNGKHGCACRGKSRHLGGMAEEIRPDGKRVSSFSRRHIWSA